MNTKHTPGPWNISSANRYAVNASGRGIATAEGADDVKYSEFFPPTEEAAANARLIAAAPDLLERCIIIERLLLPMANNPANDNFMRELRAAIAKATNP